MHCARNIYRYYLPYIDHHWKLNLCKYLEHKRFQLSSSSHIFPRSFSNIGPFFICSALIECFHETNGTRDVNLATLLLCARHAKMAHRTNWITRSKNTGVCMEKKYLLCTINILYFDIIKWRKCKKKQNSKVYSNLLIRPWIHSISNNEIHYA